MEINPRWLQLEAAKNLLVWAASRYQKKPDLMLEERINLCMNGLKGKPMRLGGPVVRMKSGSAGGSPCLLESKSTEPGKPNPSF